MRVLVSVPSRGSVHVDTVSRLQSIRDSVPGVDPIFYQEGHLNVALTRNYISKHFMEGPWDALIMVDDDVMPPPHLLELVKHTQEWDIIGVPYLMLHENMLEFTVFKVYEETGQHRFVDLEEGIHECDVVGTGCVIIHRRVFDKLGDRPFRMGADPDNFITDDFLFCQDAQAAGCKIAYVWNKWFADHCTTVSLATLKNLMVSREQKLRDSLES